VKKLFILFPLYLLFLFQDLHSNESDQAWTINVQIQVYADESIKYIIESAVNRELRSLDNVSLVYEKPRYTIEIIALSAVPNHIILSVLITSKMDFKEFAKIYVIDNQISQDFAVLNLEGYCLINEHYVKIEPMDNLNTMCKDIVSKFDVKYLEPIRRVLK
jgi:hypothetical protein